MEMTGENIRRNNDCRAGLKTGSKKSGTGRAVPVSFSVRELWERGRDDIPAELVSNTHLIYSSPATLSFNSPGAEGFGVKRAGLSVPGSVMLIVSPGCCGRNTSSISSMPGYENRFFYLTMSETDLITGRHLKRIPGAVCEIVRSLPVRPSVVMICITCVDALLGTDMERVCRRAEKLINGGNSNRKNADRENADRENRKCADGENMEEPPVRVRPCYMYALTREGRKPPMVNVRQSIYSLLEPVKRKASSVNILGFFAPLSRDCELRDLLRQAGVKKIREVSTCGDYEEFQQMAEANFNLVLNPEARPAAADLEKRHGIPSIELTRLYQIDQIAKQYDALGAVLGFSAAEIPDDERGTDKENRHRSDTHGKSWNYSAAMDAAKGSMKRFRDLYPDAHFSVGEALNGDPFEMSLALVRYGFHVDEIFGTVTSDSFRYLRHLADLTPETKVYSNLEPSMLSYDRKAADDPGKKTPVHIALGKDAAWYHPDYYCLEWGQDEQPFGFAGVRNLFDALLEAVGSAKRNLFTSDVRLQAEKTGRESAGRKPADHNGTEGQSAGSLAVDQEKDIRGFRKFLTPFAPDQSGAVSVLYELGGITVICDAGGCTGNICGFDEPRWFKKKSAVFSAGLRDMDAILGRDDKLVEKLAAAVRELSRDTPAGNDLQAADIKAPTLRNLESQNENSGLTFAAIVGTPVPAVIGSDFHALERMAEKKTGLPSIGIPCDGMEYYDVGAERTYLALLGKFCGQGRNTAAEPGEQGGALRNGRIGVWGANPMDYPEGLERAFSPSGSRYANRYANRYVICGSGTAGLRAFREASQVSRNLVVSVSGLEAAKWLERRFGIPYICENPLARQWVMLALTEAGGSVDCSRQDVSGRKILVVHEQVTANSVRENLLECGAARVDAASWFMMKKELSGEHDFALKEEADFRRIVLEGGYDAVFADPSMRGLLPEAGKIQFYDLPHFAVSGRRD